MDKIFVEGARWLGDALLSIPALGRMRRLFPQAKITIFTGPELAKIYRLLPEVDEIIEESGGSSGLKRCRKIARRLRDERFDLAVLFRNSFWSALTARLAGIPERIGYRANFRSPLLTKSLKRKPSFNSEHQYLSFINIVSSLGPASGGGLSHQIKLGRENEDWAAKWLMARGVSGGDLVIGTHPGAWYGPAKRWTPEGFASLIRKMDYDLGARVILFGGSGEAVLTSRVKALAGIDLIEAAGQLDVVQLASIMSMCDLVVCNDSGPMHLASAVNTPVVAIFGSTDPALSGPLGTGVIIRAKADCSPCFRRTCPTGLKCMNLISPDMVLAGVRQLISAARRRLVRS